MAITIVEQPQSHTPVYNDVVAVVTSNKTSEAKFKFCLDIVVTIEGLGDTTLARLKTMPVTNRLTWAAVGYFNVKDVLMFSEYFASKKIFALDDKSQAIKLVPGEEYASGSTSAAVYYPATGQTMSFVGFNGSLRLKEFVQFVPTDLINTTTIAATSGIGQYAMTTYTSTKKILTSTVNELTFLCNGGTNTKAVVTYYNGTTQIGTQDIAVTTANKTDITVDISPSVLTIPTLTDNYTIKLVRISNGNALSPTYAYSIGDVCTKFKLINVYFQNKWGGMDSFVFNMRETINDDITRKNYKKPDRYISGYNSYDEARNTYFSEIVSKHELNTDWVTEAEMNWLSELVESNMVLMSYDDNGWKYASIDVIFTNWVSEGTSATTDGRSFVTPLGSLSFSIPSGTFYETYGDDYITAIVIPELESSGLNTDYNFINIGSASVAAVRITAKVSGANYAFTSNIAIGTTSIDNLVGGTGMPQLIPITVDTNTFTWKQSKVDKLFQLKLNVTETPVLNRQTQ